MQNSYNNRNHEIDDEIDLSYLLDLIKRNKYLIASISFLSFLVLVIYAICKPKIWQGSFQIVLEPNKNQPNLCTLVNKKVSSLDKNVVLYQSRANIKGSVVCHLGEVHLKKKSRGNIIDYLNVL